MATPNTDANRRKKRKSAVMGRAAMGGTVASARVEAEAPTITDKLPSDRVRDITQKKQRQALLAKRPQDTVDPQTGRRTSWMTTTEGRDWMRQQNLLRTAQHKERVASGVVTPYARATIGNKTFTATGEEIRKQKPGYRLGARVMRDEFARQAQGPVGAYRAAKAAGKATPGQLDAAFRQKAGLAPRPRPQRAPVDVNKGIQRKAGLDLQIMALDEEISAWNKTRDSSIEVAPGSG